MRRVRRVLLISYFFPPIGGAGVQRSAKLAKHLLERGYETVVVTGPLSTASSRWAPTDPSLSRDVPPTTVVIRAEGPAPGSDGGRAGRLLGLGTPFGRWWPEAAVSAVSRAVLPDSIVAVIATMSPFESAEAASNLAARLGVPWIADLRDPWALDEMIVYPTRAHRRLARRSMARALATASAVVMNTPEASRALTAQLQADVRRRVVTIPNGFDADDFAGPAPPRRDDGLFRIVHSGYLHTELGLEHRQRGTLRRLAGGAAPGVDFLTRSHVMLLRAMDALARSDPDVASLVELHLVGALTEADERALAGHHVRPHGYLPHRETVELLRSADLLFLPMHDLPPGTRATIVPGKTYEYLAAGPPVLAAVPDGDARDLLEEAGNATLVRPGDVAAMTDALRRHVTCWQQGGRVKAADTAVLARYERRTLAGRMGDLLDEVVGAPPASARQLEAGP